MTLDKKSPNKNANIVGKHIKCKSNFVQHMGNSAANVEDQIIFLLFVCHQKRHSENGGNQFTYNRRDRRDIRRATNEFETDDSESDDNGDPHFIDETVRHLTVGKIKVNKVNDFEKTVPIVINDVIVHIEPDSGVDVNVMDEYHYKAFKRKSYENLALHDSSTRLSTLQNKLHVSGELKATAHNETRETDTTFVVVKGKINLQPLLGRRTLIELRMLEIRQDRRLKESNELH